MSANLENSAVAPGLEKVSFHSNSKERQCQRMLKLLYSCTYLTQVKGQKKGGGLGIRSGHKYTKVM